MIRSMRLRSALKSRYSLRLGCRLRSHYLAFTRLMQWMHKAKHLHERRSGLTITKRCLRKQQPLCSEKPALKTDSAARGRFRRNRSKSSLCKLRDSSYFFSSKRNAHCQPSFDKLWSKRKRKYRNKPLPIRRLAEVYLPLLQEWGLPLRP